MRILFITLIFLISCDALSAPKRFKIKNQINGLEFQVERENFVHQPEYGKPARRVRAGDESEQEKWRCNYSNIEEEVRQPDNENKLKKVLVKYCDLPDDWSVVEEDIASEIEAKEKEKSDRKKIRDEIKALKSKSSLTNAERDKILLYLIKQIDE